MMMRILTRIIRVRLYAAWLENLSTVLLRNMMSDFPKDLMAALPWNLVTRLSFPTCWNTGVRGRFKIKNTIICGKSPKGGGVRAKIKKVYISNVDSL